MRMNSSYKKFTSILVITAFLLTSLQVETLFARDIVVEDIAAQSVFSPLANTEIKDIAMLKYALTAGIQSDKVDMLKELNDVTSGSFGVDLGRENVNMTFHFSDAEYYEKTSLRLVPCTLIKEKETLRYWCCAFEGAGKKGSCKMTFFTDNEKDQNDIVNKIHILKTEQRVENLAIQRAARSELNQDEVIREAIAEDQYKTIPSSYLELYAVYAFLDTVSPEISRDFRAMVDSGQLMIIGTTEAGKRLEKPHAGAQGIYVPKDEKFVNAPTFVHEVFARSGFTHTECVKFEEIFKKYLKSLIDDTPDKPQTFPEEMLGELLPEDKSLLARAAGSLGFVDAITFIKMRDYSSKDDGEEERTEEGDDSSTENEAPHIINLSPRIYARSGKTPSVEDVDDFFFRIKDTDVFIPVEDEAILKAIALFRSIGRERESAELGKLLIRKKIRMVTRPQGKNLFSGEIWGVYKDWTGALFGDSLEGAARAAFKVEPWIFISADIAKFERDHFLSTMANLSAAAAGRPEEDRATFTQSMNRYGRGRSRSERIPTIAEVERDVDAVMSLPRAANPPSLIAVTKALEILNMLGLTELQETLEQMVKKGRLRIVKPKGVFSEFYGAVAAYRGEEYIFLSEDVSAWDSSDFLPTLCFCLAEILGYPDEKRIELEAMESTSAAAMGRILKALDKKEEAEFLLDIAQENRIRSVNILPITDSVRKSCFMKDGEGNPWIFVSKDVVGPSNGSYMPAVVSAVAEIMWQGRGQEGKREELVRTVSEDARVVIRLSSHERMVLSGLIRELEEFKSETTKWIQLAALSGSIKSSVWERLLREKDLSEKIIGFHLDEDESVGISDLSGKEGKVHLQGVKSACISGDEDTPPMEIKELDICRYISRGLESGISDTDKEKLIDFIIDGVKQDLDVISKDGRDRQLVSEIVWQKIVKDFRQSLKEISYVIKGSGFLVTAGDSPIEKELVDRAMRKKVDVQNVILAEGVLSHGTALDKLDVERAITAAMLKYPEEVNMVRIADEVVAGLKDNGNDDPWDKVMIPSLSLSRKIKGSLLPENRGNIIGVILSTITYGAFSYYKATLTQDLKEDVHSLASVDLMNGVTAVMSGYSQMAASSASMRDVLVKAFTPEGMVQQRYDNILGLLKDIETLGSAVMITNTGKSWSAPIIDIVGTMSAAGNERSKKYHDLFDTVPVGIHVISPNGKIKDVSRYELDLLGYSKEEMVGKSVWKFAHPDQREDVRRRVLYRGLGKPDEEIPRREFKYRIYRTKEGKDVIVSTHDTVVYNDDGRVVEVRTVLRDITKYVEAEERIRGMLENMPSAVFFKEYDSSTDEFRFKYANSKFYEFLGIDPDAESIIGLTEYEVRDKCKREGQDVPYQAEWYDKDDRAVFEGKATYYKEEEIMGWNGHQATVHRQKERMGNGVLGVFTDISEVKSAQEAVQKSETLYRNLFEHMMDGFAYHEMIYDENGEPIDYFYKQVNATFAEMLGMKGKDIVGKTVKELLPGTEKFWLEKYSEVVKTGEPKKIENYSRILDRWFLVTAYRPEPGHFAVVVEDITERKKDAIAIRKSEDRYKRLVEMASDAIWKSDPNGRFSFVSERLSEMSGYSEEELLNMNVAEILTTDSFRRYLDFIAEEWDLEKKGGSVPSYLEVDQVRKDGTIIRCEISAIPVRDESGIAIGVSGITRDISERIKLREEKAYLTSIIETTTDIATVKDLEGRIITVNQAFIDQLPVGKLKSDVIGRTDEEVFAGLVDSRTIQGYIKDEEKARSGKTVEKIEKIPGGRIVHTQKFPIYRGREIIATANISRDITDSERTKKSLLDATEKFETVFKSSPLPMIIFDSMTQTCVNANTAACELYGYTLEEFQELDPEEMRKGDLVMEEVDLDHYAHKPVRRDRGEAIHFTSEQIKSDGSIFNAKITMFNFNADKNMLMGFIVEDITGIEHTKDKLAREIRLSRLTNEVTHVLMTSGDLNEVSKMMREKLGLFGVSFGLLTPGTEILEIRGCSSEFPSMVQSAVRKLKFDLSLNKKAKVFFDSINGPTRISANELIEFISDEDSIEEVVSKGVKKLLGDGHFGEMLFFPFKDRRGNLVGAVLLSKAEGQKFDNREKSALGHLALDIGFVLERDRMAQILASSEERYKTLISLDPDAIAVTQNKKFVLVNDALTEMLGVSSDELLGQGLKKFTADESLRKMWEDYDTQFPGKKKVTIYEAELVRSDGTLVQVEISAGNIQHKGAPAGLFSIRDISERKRIEEELSEYRSDLEEKVEERSREIERINKELALKERLAALGQMAAGVAHELRNPVTSAAGMIRMFMEDGDAGHLTEALSELVRSNGIVEDLLGYSREEGLSLEPANYSEILKTAVIKCRNVIEDYDVNVELDLDESVVIEADPDRLMQVFINLVTNACHAMENRHQRVIRIVMRPDAERGKAVAEIVDTGSGMSEEVLEKLFSPFFTTKRTGKGTGLGMALVQKILASHEGGIEVKSRVNYGTSFVVKIPLTDKPVAERTVVRKERSDNTPEVVPVRKIKNLLLVDDEENIKKIWTYLIESLGMNIFTASNASEAMRVYDENDIDAVITDVNMAPTSVEGFILSVLLRQKGFEGPIAVATGGDINEKRIVSLREDGIIDAALIKTPELLSKDNIAECICSLEKLPDADWDIEKVNAYAETIAEGSVSNDMFGRSEDDMPEVSEDVKIYRIVPYHPKGFKHEVRSHINGLSLMEYLPEDMQYHGTERLLERMVNMAAYVERIEEKTTDMSKALRLSRIVVHEYGKMSDIYKQLLEREVVSELRKKEKEYTAAKFADFLDSAEFFETACRRGYDFLDAFLKEAEVNIAAWETALAQEKNQKPAFNENVKVEGTLQGAGREVVSRRNKHDLRNIIQGVAGNLALLEDIRTNDMIYPENFPEIVNKIKAVSTEIEKIPSGNIAIDEEAIEYMEQYIEALYDLREGFRKVFAAVRDIYSSNAFNDDLDPQTIEILGDIDKGIRLLCNENSDATRQLIALSMLAENMLPKWRREEASYAQRTPPASFDDLLSSAEKDFLEGVDSSFVGIIFLNIEGYMLFGNRSSMDILGRKSYQEIVNMSFLGSPVLSSGTIDNLQKGFSAELDFTELIELKNRGIFNRNIEDMKDITVSITPLAMEEGGAAGFVLQIYDNARESEVKGVESYREGLDICNMISSGRVSALPSKTKALELQMISAEKVALIFGSHEKGISVLRRSGFKGEIRFARDIEELNALHALGKLDDVDIVVNTTSMDIKLILQNMQLEVAVVDGLSDANTLQNTLLEICA